MKCEDSGTIKKRDNWMLKLDEVHERKKREELEGTTEFFNWATRRKGLALAEMRKTIDHHAGVKRPIIHPSRVAN